MREYRTLARAYNVREGFTCAADTLPSRNLDEPLSGGGADGHTVDLAPMLDEYYRIMGWDKNGVPTKEKINELNLDINWNH